MCFLLLLFLFDSGDILVFLTGQDEIESLAKLITDCAQHCGSGEFNLLLQGNCLAAQAYKHYFSGEEKQKLEIHLCLQQKLQFIS